MNPRSIGLEPIAVPLGQPPKGNRNAVLKKRSINLKFSLRLFINMKIGIVTLAVYPDSKDGSAKYIRGLFDALKRRGHEVKLFAAKWGEGADDPGIQLVKVPPS